MKRRLPLIAIAVVVTVSAPVVGQEFASMTIDVGVVVSDIEKSVKFYTDALGMKQVPGFSVPADFAGAAGLTADRMLDVRVLVVDDGEGATKLKLMQIPGVKTVKANHEFIHSTLGLSYLTIAVTDTNKALARLKKANVKPLAKTPIALPAPLPTHIFLTLVRDPDGNLIELVGPKP